MMTPADPQRHADAAAMSSCRIPRPVPQTAGLPVPFLYEHFYLFEQNDRYFRERKTWFVKGSKIPGRPHALGPASRAG